MKASDTKTQELLKALAEQVAALDPEALQREMNELQLEAQELSRRMQERQFALQLKQMEAQRQSHHRPGSTQRLWSTNTEIEQGLRQMGERLRELDESSLNQEIADLQVEIQEVNRQIQERQYAVQLQQMQIQRDQERMDRAVVSPGVMAPAFRATGGSPVGAQSGGLDSEAKRQAILDIMGAQPGQSWTPGAVRTALRERGVGDPDAGTPVRSLMWRMEKDQVLERPRKGVYALRSPDGGSNDDASGA